MAIEIFTRPCLKDNYAHILVNMQTLEAIVVDVPEAAVINEFFAQFPQFRLKAALLTHHHWDHIDGLADLDTLSDLHVIGHSKDQARLPELSQQVSVGDVLSVCGVEFQVFETNGHTIGHVSYFAPNANAVFTGDSIMTYGCGRLFEGTAEQMYAGFQAIGSLPDETRVFCGHNYAQDNLSFAAAYAPDEVCFAQCVADTERQSGAGQTTTGRTLAIEKKVNPYFRTHLPQVKRAAGVPEGSDVEVFAEIRAQKDIF